MLVNILGIIDDAKCYEVVRQLRWPDGVRCAHCDSARIVKQGRDETEPHRQRYECRSCGRRFDDLTETIFAGHHQRLRVWVLVLYFMGLDLSNEQMASRLREGIVERKPQARLGDVGFDGVYVVAGHNGHPTAVRKKGGPGAGGG